MVITAGLLRVAGVETLVVGRPATIDPGRASGALAAPSWLGPEIDAPVGFRRYLSDLAFPLLTKPRTVTFRKAAFVDLGPVMRLPDGSIVVEVGWRSATLAPLFPVFAGRLLVRAGGLRLEGAYAPPLGEFGRLIDRAVLHEVAVRTGRWFLAAAAAHLATDSSAGPDRPDGR